MPNYEHVFIARQDVSGAQVESITDGFVELVETNGGKVTKREHWGLKNLAYRIKKNRKGHYVLFNLDAPSDAVLELERNQRLHEDVLRYLTIRLDELEEGPSIQMQNKSARDGRRGDRERGDRERGDRDRDRGDRDRDRGRGERSATPSEASEAPAETPAKTPAETPADTPAEAPAEAATEKGTET